MVVRVPEERRVGQHQRSIPGVPEGCVVGQSGERQEPAAQPRGVRDHRQIGRRGARTGHEPIEERAGPRISHRREEVPGPGDVDAEQRRHDLCAGRGIAIAHHLEDQGARQCVVAGPLLARQGVAPDAVSARHRLQLLEIEAHELDAGLGHSRRDQSSAFK